MFTDVHNGIKLWKPVSMCVCVRVCVCVHIDMYLHTCIVDIQKYLHSNIIAYQIKNYYYTLNTFTYYNICNMLCNTLHIIIY